MWSWPKLSARDFNLWDENQRINADRRLLNNDESIWIPKFTTLLWPASSVNESASQSQLRYIFTEIIMHNKNSSSFAPWLTDIQKVSTPIDVTTTMGRFFLYVPLFARSLLAGVRAVLVSLNPFWGIRVLQTFVNLTNNKIYTWSCGGEVSRSSTFYTNTLAHKNEEPTMVSGKWELMVTRQKTEKYKKKTIPNFRIV